MTHLEWPFFEERHRRLAETLERWALANVPNEECPDVDAGCRALVAVLGRDGWLQYVLPDDDGHFDVRAICLVREILARRNAIADFAFAMQGLGSAAITLAGSPALRVRYLPKVGAGLAIAAFALSEPEAGSDAAALTTTARLEGSEYVLNGEKTWISNGGIADFYVVFARTGEEEGRRGISAFVVDAQTPGLDASARIEVMAPHPLATLCFRDCRVEADCKLGAGGDGFTIAMLALDVFRSSVAAAALGLARRALDESLAHATSRRLFGERLSDFQLSRAALAEMATGIDASALLTYRAAWLHDTGLRPTTREAAMAKLASTETAQMVIDQAVQLHGALGVTRGTIVERLYREIRALRIYEGASEVQQLIVGRETLRAFEERSP